MPYPQEYNRGMEQTDMRPIRVDYEALRDAVDGLFAEQKVPAQHPPEVRASVQPASGNPRRSFSNRPPRIFGNGRHNEPLIYTPELNQPPRIISTTSAKKSPTESPIPISPRRLALPKTNDAFISPDQRKMSELDISDALGLNGDAHVRAFYDEAEQTDQPWFYFSRAVLENLFVRYWLIHPEILQNIIRYAKSALQISLTHFVIAPTTLHLERLLLTFETAAGIGNEQRHALWNAERDFLMAEEDIRRLLSLDDQDGLPVIQRIAETLKIPTEMVSRESATIVAVGRCNRAKLTLQRMRNKHARLRYDFLKRIADQTYIDIVPDAVGRVELRLKRRMLDTG